MRRDLPLSESPTFGAGALRVLSAEEIAQMLALHELYLKAGYHKGHRANFSSDLSDRDFAGLSLRALVFSMLLTMEVTRLYPTLATIW